MRSRLVGRLLLVMHESGFPHDDEWNATTALLAINPHDQLRVMVFTEGGGPSPKQQARLSSVVTRRTRPLLVAVVSESTAIRFMASALAFFLPRIRTFPRSELDRACQHLELNDQEQKAALEFTERPSQSAW